MLKVVGGVFSRKPLRSLASASSEAAGVVDRQGVEFVGLRDKVHSVVVSALRNKKGTSPQKIFKMMEAEVDKRFAERPGLEEELTGLRQKVAGFMARGKTTNDGKAKSG